MQNNIKRCAMLAAAASLAVLGAGTGTASALPTGITHGISQYDNGTYFSYAGATGGTGQIRTSLGCEADSGGETWTEYGPWVGVHHTSFTNNSCSEIYNNGAYELKN